MQLKELTDKAMKIRAKYALFETKNWGKEWNDEQIVQGFVGDVGDLVKLVMAKKGLRKIENVDAKLRHELADCLWCILVLSQKFDIDLEKSFLDTMDEIDKKIS